MSLKVGVLALQGGFHSHVATLKRLGVSAQEVRTCADLVGCDGLILPGGESTVQTKLLEGTSLLKALLEWEKPLFGTCAGLILLALWGRLQVVVKRNAYGRQADSFSTKIDVTFPQGTRECLGVFIRAPQIVALPGGKVEVLATYRGQAVLVREGKVLGATFHPELTEEEQIHTFFLDGIGRENGRLDGCRK